MQFFWALQVLVFFARPLINFAFRVLGVGFVTYVGYNALISLVVDYITSNMSRGNIDIQMILGLAKVDVAINIMISAVTTRMIIAGLDKVQDRKRNQVWRAPGGTSIDA